MSLNTNHKIDTLINSKRIIVTGPSGAGKSYLSKLLHNKTGLPLYHLDLIYWKKDKTHISREEFDLKLDEILKEDKWIIDGTYKRTQEKRIKCSDTIIVLNFPLDECLKGVENRIGKKRSDIPWIEDEFDNEFRDWIIKYHQEELPKLFELLKKYDDKNIIILDSRRDFNDLLKLF